ncbi:MAG: hypothetical protein GX625_01630 [Clostridiaceae bacterium]|nr:hypothetical protein [Clostridiaceae bacterium]
MSESMRGIQFKKSGIRLLAILLVLICLPLISVSSSIDNGSIMQDANTADKIHDLISACGAGKDAWQLIVHQNPLGDLFLYEADFFKNIQRSLSWENNSHIMTFCDLSYSRFFRVNPNFTSLYGPSRIPASKVKYFLIAIYSPNAPPYILV